MSIDAGELIDSARKAFASWEDARDADAVWSTMAEMGWFMMLVPEDAGGLGLPRSVASALFAEFGRVLMPGNVTGQFVALEALAHGQDFDGRAEWIERAMMGERIAVALTLDGTSAVVDADRAEWMLERGDDAVALVSLTGAALTEHATWDESRRLFDVTPATDAERIVLASGDDAQALNARLDGLACLALAGDALGGAQAALAMSVEYLKDRRQFDRPLAMFQALKHRAADLRKDIALAESLLWERAGEEDASRLDLGALKSFAAQVYRDVAEEAVQFHGGIGLTVELPVHLFLKRAMLNCVLAGDADYWREAAGQAALA